MMYDVWFIVHAHGSDTTYNPYYLLLLLLLLSLLLQLDLLLTLVFVV